MTTKEFYEVIGGDYDEISRRIPSDILIRRFLLKFPADPSYPDLLDARARQDVKGAFLAAHTLKGVAATLGLNTLAEPAARLSDLLRPLTGFPDDEAFDAVTRAYRQVTEQLALLLS